MCLSADSDRIADIPFHLSVSTYRQLKVLPVRAGVPVKYENYILIYV